MNIHWAVLQETKFPNEFYSHHCLGYTIYATKTSTRNQGGVALVWKTQATNWTFESPVLHGPNVISALFVSGSQRTPVIGAYLPPNCLKDLPYLEQALQRFPHLDPLLLGDLNVDLHKATPDRRLQEVSALLTAYGLEDFLCHFHQRPRYSHRQTFHRYDPVRDKT